MAPENSEDPGSTQKAAKQKDARPIVWLIGFLIVALCVYFVLLGGGAVSG